MGIKNSTTSKQYVDTQDASLSTSTSTGLSSANNSLASLSTLVGGGGSTSAVSSAIASLSTATSSVVSGATSAVNSAVASLSTSTSTGLSSVESNVSSLRAFRYITQTPNGGDISVELNSLISAGILKIGIPAGQYNVSTPIIMKSGLDILGSGWTRTKLQPTSVFSNMFTTNDLAVSTACLDGFSVELKRPTTPLVGDFLTVFNFTRLIYSRVENIRVFTNEADVSDGVFKVRMVLSSDDINARSNTFKNLLVICPTVTDTGVGNAAARLGFPNTVVGMNFTESGNNNYVNNCAFTGCKYPIKMGSGVNGNHIIGNSFEKFDTGFTLNGAWQNNFGFQRNELGINAVEITGAGTAPLGRNNHFYAFDYITVELRWSALTTLATQNFQMISAFDSTSTSFLRVTTGIQGNLPMANNGIQLVGYTGYTNLTSFTNPNAVANNIAVVNGEPYFTYSSGNRFPLNRVQDRDLIKRYTWTTTASQNWASGTSFILGETVLAGSPTLTAIRDLPYLGVALGGTPAAPNGTFSELGAPNGYFKMNNTVTKKLIIDLRFSMTAGSYQDFVVQLIKWSGTAWVNVPGATRKAWRSNDGITENSTNFLTFSTGLADDFNTGVFAFRFSQQSGSTLAFPPQDVILTFAS